MKYIIDKKLDVIAEPFYMLPEFYVMILALVLILGVVVVTAILLYKLFSKKRGGK